MNRPDDLSQYYAELLDGIYDCVDRIVLNAFFPLGQTGGGVRSWCNVAAARAEVCGFSSQGSIGLGCIEAPSYVGSGRRKYRFCHSSTLPLV